MGRAHEVRAAAMAKTAAAKSKLNAKWGKAIYAAAKSGVPNPDLNQALKREIEKAKKEQVNNDVIQRAIDKAKGGVGEAYVFERYEGFGPGNSMWIVDCLTDNHNRTLTSIRTAFSRVGGNLGTPGSVMHAFQNQAVFSFEGVGEEEVLEELLLKGCENIDDIQSEEGVVSIFAPYTEYQAIHDALVESYPALEFLEDHVTYVPLNYVKLETERDKDKFSRFMAMLDECDDVQNIYHNVESE